MMLTAVFCFAVCFGTGCRRELSSGAGESPIELSDEFKSYWYAGVAELTSYDLEQVRYGEVRKGLATAVFVTEDFSKSRYVKLDFPEQAGSDKQSVLKFNLNKRFLTGIYEYTLMESVFTPVDLSSGPLRVTTSNIEWCGQFLTTARRKGNHYEVQYNSYFDGEEATQLSLEAVTLEDEIWNLIRIEPDRLPLGALRMIPGILTQELTHNELKVEQAEASLQKGDSTSVYTINYPAINRTLVIEYENDFPRVIVGWDETFQTVEGWGLASKVMTTRARRVSTYRSPYWEEKYLRHEALREQQLGIGSDMLITH